MIPNAQVTSYKRYTGTSGAGQRVWSAELAAPPPGGGPLPVCAIADPSRREVASETARELRADRVVTMLAGDIALLRARAGIAASVIFPGVGDAIDVRMSGATASETLMVVEVRQGSRQGLAGAPQRVTLACQRRAGQGGQP